MKLFSTCWLRRRFALSSPILCTYTFKALADYSHCNHTHNLNVCSTKCQITSATQLNYIMNGNSWGSVCQQKGSCLVCYMQRLMLHYRTHWILDEPSIKLHSNHNQGGSKMRQSTQAHRTFSRSSSISLLVLLACKFKQSLEGRSPTVTLQPQTARPEYIRTLLNLENRPPIFHVFVSSWSSVVHWTMLTCSSGKLTWCWLRFFMIDLWTSTVTPTT